jgi:hypothetical protein
MRARNTSLSIIWLMTLLAGSLLLPRGRVWAQAANGITSPASGDTMAGIVIVEGTATDANFLRYELAFMQMFNQGAGWIVFAEGDQPVTGGTLAVWDTTVGVNINAPVFPDGQYQLRLRVVRTDYNYDEYFVTALQVSNGEATPTAEATEPGGGAERTPVATAGATGVATSQPEVLPTLTPFPTPTPQATPADDPNLALPAEDEGGDGPSLFEQLGGVDTSRFGRAFWRGARLSLFLFALLAAYVLFRAIFRRLWRLIMSRLLQQ